MINQDGAGMLYLVATPIGNLGDITLRALQTLEEVDYVAAEDTRRTVKLLNHFELKKQQISFHEYSDEKRRGELIALLRAGKKIALLTDAGTPIISDPGFVLVEDCVREGIAVTSIPGACAAVTAVTLSAMDCRRFVFLGFLSAKTSEREREISGMRAFGMPCIIYESPHRILKTLEQIGAVLGQDTRVCVARELTKIHEECLRASVHEALETLRARDSIKGEFVVLVLPQQQTTEVTDELILQELRAQTRGSKKDAVRGVVARLGVPKNRVYQIMIGEKDEKPQG